MATRFKVGDHVRWNSEAGLVSGRIIKVHTRDTQYKGHPRHCTEDDPQYEIRSDKSEHIAMHKGSALRKLWSADIGPSHRVLVLRAQHRIDGVADVRRYPGWRRPVWRARVAGQSGGTPARMPGCPRPWPSPAAS